MTPSFLTAITTRHVNRPRGAVDRRPDRVSIGRSLVVVACNTASTLVLSASARGVHGAVRRHRAGDQAGLRGIGDKARFGPRHAGHREARIYPQADQGFCARAATSSSSARAQLARIAESASARRAGRRRRNCRGDRALLRRWRMAGAPMRSCSPARTTRCLIERLRETGALDGDVDRSGCRDRTPRHRPDRPVAGTARDPARGGRLYVEARARNPRSLKHLLRRGFTLNAD